MLNYTSNSSKLWLNQHLTWLLLSLTLLFSQPIWAETIDLSTLLQQNKISKNKISSKYIPPKDDIVYIALIDALKLALANNLEIKIHSLDKERAIQEYKGSHAPFDLLFRYNIKVDTNYPGDKNSEINSTNQINSDLSLQKKFITGTLVDLIFGAIHDKKISSTKSEDLKIFSSNLSLTVRQPLLQGGGIGFNEADLKIAHNLIKWENLAFIQKLEDLIYNVIEGYLNAIAAYEHIEIEKFALKKAKNIKMLIEKRIKIGKAITSDLVQAKTSLSLTEESVITAEVNYSKALLYLQQMICPKMIYNKTRIKINPATSFDMELGQEQLTVKEKETIDLAFKHRKDLKQTNILMANSEISLEKHNSNTMPSLDVFGTVLQRKESDKINTSFVGFNSKPSWLIGLSFSTPFIDHNANSELGKAKLNRRKRELQIESVKNQIALEVKTGILDLYSAYQKMIISKKTCQYAEEQFTSEMTRFENGLSTTFIINQLRLEKSKSELSLVRSKVKYLLARLYLDKIIGVLLQSKLTIKSKM